MGMALLFASLDSDTVVHATSFLPSVSILALSSTSHEWMRIFRPAVLQLALSKLSLRGAPLAQALQAVCRRFPLLMELSLANSAASDDDLVLLASALRDNSISLTRLSLESCDAISDGALARAAAAMPSLHSVQLLGCRE